MRQRALEVKYEVTIEPGEGFSLPPSVAKLIGEGRWLVTIQSVGLGPVRDHSAFLANYVAEDEGLYDECPAG